MSYVTSKKTSTKWFLSSEGLGVYVKVKFHMCMWCEQWKGFFVNKED